MKNDNEVLTTLGKLESNISSKSPSIYQIYCKLSVMNSLVLFPELLSMKLGQTYRLYQN